MIGMLLSWAVVQANAVELLEETIVDSSALNFADSNSNFSNNVNGRTFQRDPMVTSRGYQYAIYYNANRRVCVGRRKLPVGDWDVITFTDYRINGSNSHDVAAIGICESDGTIHLAFDHHRDTLNYRVSILGAASDPENVGWSTELFGPTTDRLGSVGVVRQLTYPTFFPAPNGNLMFYYRFGGSGDGDGFIQEYNGTTHDWTRGLGEFISRDGTYNGAVSSNSRSRCPYLNGISYGGNRLHASWGWRESAGGARTNHDLNYAYSDDHGRTWRNNAGRQIGVTGSSPISIDSPGLIVADIPQDIGLSNQYTHYAYPDGSCHVIVAHRDANNNQRSQHYWRNAAGVWSNTTLPLHAGRGKVVGDDDRNLFLVYQSAGRPTIAQGVPNQSLTAWSWSQVYSQVGTTEGGEGKIDFTRWEQDRVLSFYGQERPPNLNETPSPVHVFDYLVSAKATQPNPAHGAVVEDMEAELSWRSGISGGTHRVYFGSDQLAVRTATTESPEYQGEQAGTTFTPNNLPAIEARYYWRIDVVGPDAAVVPGLVWEFDFVPESTVNPIAHWPLDEGSGNLAADTSVNGLDGLLLDGASWSSDGERDSFVVFDGQSGRISTPLSYALAESDSFTWAWWAKRTTPPGIDNGAIMVGNRYGGSGSENLEFIKFTPTGAQFANTNDASELGRYGYSIPTEQWNHYAMVKSGPSYQFYINGTFIASTEPAFNYEEMSPIPFLIGGDDDGSGTRINEHFQGAIDDVVLYRRALTPQEVSNVMDEIYLPTVTMSLLGSPADSTAGTTWSDGLPAHIGARYIVPALGNLRGESGETVFPGSALVVQAGGRFQVRAIAPDVTIVDNLILEGGSTYSAGDFVELAAGTGSGVTNIINGSITQSGTTRLLTFSSVARKLQILSLINGNGIIQVTGEGAIIENSANRFSGLWEVAENSELIFETGGSVGPADISVQAGGTLEIRGDWPQEAMLSVADNASTEIKIGPNEWFLSQLMIGGTRVADGLYTPEELSSLGNAFFSGTGRITVGLPLFTQAVIAGWDIWSSATTPSANLTAEGIIATATASTSAGTWNTLDDDSSGRGSSGDMTWGSFDGNGSPASAVTSEEGANMTAPNGVGTADLTLTITNQGPTDWALDAFHMDVLAFRPNAPRSYQVEVVSGDITHGVVLASEDNAIAEVGGTLSASHDQHEQVDVNLVALADSTLESGGTVTIRITFSNGTGSGSGHHLFLDNVAVSGTLISGPTALQNWRLEHFGTIEDSGISANQSDANFDGENNFLEFATGQDPYARTRLSTELEINEDSLEFRYPRNTAALADGIRFGVEWSDTLLEDSWNGLGVIDDLDSLNPGNGEIENRIVTLPLSPTGKRFLRLRLIAP